ncbi:hnh endonuclease [Halosimplex carlsbadense 2-9-1]|uniref:Hnh endonuclease n=1 Tax=Halosimplex carlsbadense 2-9-1 TaxID=797114 RepID=M0CCV3_9EURY|nr:HNH endonuclease signature motif containing protein [Halosimplex carlsbadense]ELZ21060.1 hnh endonuclease [Halosimplex carlsbadense 2-9-1]
MTGSEREQCHEPVDQATRAEMLEAYEYRCQACGRCGPEAGGLATLHVHHIERDPDGMGEHDAANLTVLCRACHSWQHQQTPVDDVPIEVTEADQTELLRQDMEILKTVVEIGPATTGAIAGALSIDLSPWAVRERLWVLMGLDNLVAGRETQIVDQDAKTGEWGVPEQIALSARGRVPSDPGELLQRIEDEYVRRALDRGCDRDAVAAVLDVSERATFYKHKRACAFDVPLDAIDRRGGRPVEDSDDQRAGAASEPDERAGGDVQQQLDVVADGAGASTDSHGEEDCNSESSEVGSGGGSNGGQVITDNEAVRKELRRAISALQEVDSAL